MIFLTLLIRVYLFLLMLNMNILIWNCRDALNPTFRNGVNDLVQLHSPAIMIVTETKVGGNRAKEIASRLPFDGAIISSTIGLTGGLPIVEFLLCRDCRVILY